jgi:HPt (histidine-containing phosphotransfer) domain-containing protein
MDRPGVSPVVDDDRIDEEILDELFLIMGDGDTGGLVKACDMFLNGMPDRFADIDTALADGRFEDAAQSAHSLRGSAGAFGARRLSALTVPLEQHCRSGNVPAAVTLLGEMQGEFRIFRAILGARLGQLSA